MPFDLISEKGLPHSLDAERSVLGALILENESIYRIQDFLRSADFYAENHKILFERIAEIIGRTHAVDLLILKEELARSDWNSGDGTAETPAKYSGVGTIGLLPRIRESLRTYEIAAMIHGSEGG